MARGGAARVAGQIGAILLAAGASRRMGAANKLLMPIDGVPMVARVAATIVEAGLPTVIVLGHEADAVQRALSPHAATRAAAPRMLDRHIFIYAPAWSQGMGASLSAGASAIPAHWAGALVCLGDMPLVAADLLRGLAAALAGPETVAVPVHAGRRGNPVAWGRAWFARLAGMEGDTGARALLASLDPVEIAADASVLRDFDSPSDFMPS